MHNAASPGGMAPLYAMTMSPGVVELAEMCGISVEKAKAQIAEHGGGKASTAV